MTCLYKYHTMYGIFSLHLPSKSTICRVNIPYMDGMGYGCCVLIEPHQKKKTQTPEALAERCHFLFGLCRLVAFWKSTLCWRVLVLAVWLVADTLAIL